VGFGDESIYACTVRISCAFKCRSMDFGDLLTVHMIRGAPSVPAIAEFMDMWDLVMNRYMHVQ
jgi:hypothetical protein